ncbi:MAG: dethiobiotin synthase [Propionibacteriaceae bacterium]
MTMTLSRPITLITGTDTDAGKTVATAVLAAYLNQRGTVQVVNPCQTGMAPGEPGGDVEIVRDLAGLDPNQCHEWSRLPEPLAPTTAARRAGVTLPSVADLADRIIALSDAGRVLVEGAGGVLVGLDSEGHTLLELADALRARGAEPTFVVVCRAGLGSLNHTQLTVNAIRERGHRLDGLIIGAWPADVDLASACNREDLPLLTGLPLVATIPAGIGRDLDAIQRYAKELHDHT